MYNLAANLTLIVHFAFIIFVAFGSLLFFLVSKKIIYIHVPALIWAIYIELKHFVCPLTYLENWFLLQGNLTTYSGDFIQNYIIPIVYPKNLTEDTQTKLAIVLIVANIIAYGLIINKLKKKKPDPNLIFKTNQEK